MGFEAQSEAVSITKEQEVQLRAATVARAAKDFAAIDSASTDEERFYCLPSASIAAYHLGNFERAREFAEKALVLSSSFQKNWNYGNALNYAHSVLGLLALEEGDIDVAIEELSKAGATPGSPQLNSFGPTMHLAKRLLQRGQSDAVIAYFEQCRSFWKLGEVWLDIWTAKVQAGGVPNFSMHLYP
jgi:tetratricopeptide (TPR) repeat protein